MSILLLEIVANGFVQHLGCSFSVRRCKLVIIVRHSELFVTVVIVTTATSSTLRENILLSLISCLIILMESRLTACFPIKILSHDWCTVNAHCVLIMQIVVHFDLPYVSIADGWTILATGR